MLTYGVVLLHENARPRTAACTLGLLEHFSRELFHCPPYSSDLALRDYHLFTCAKNWFVSQSFISNDLMEGVNVAELTGSRLL
jgi:hypothetical protein